MLRTYHVFPQLWLCLENKTIVIYMKYVHCFVLLKTPVYEETLTNTMNTSLRNLATLLLPEAVVRCQR